MTDTDKLDEIRGRARPEFLRAMAKVLKNRAAASKEDREFWANKHNGEVCDCIAGEFEWLIAEVERLRADIVSLAEAAGPCESGRDGECYGKKCPQEHDGGKNYRTYCVRARHWEAKWEAEGHDVR